MSRGSLMLGQGVSKFSDFTDSISVHLVECSPALRAMQQKKLGIVLEQQEVNTNLCKDASSRQNPQNLASTTFNCSFSWYADLEQVPHGGNVDFAICCNHICPLFSFYLERFTK